MSLYKKIRSHFEFSSDKIQFKYRKDIVRFRTGSVDQKIPAGNKLTIYVSILC